MTKQLLFAVICISGMGTNATAQTITSANFLTDLSTTTNIVVDNPTSFNLSLTTTIGSGVTWDASGLTAQGGYPIIHLEYGDPLDTPNGSLFPMANYVYYDPALTAVVSYDYIHINADSITTAGNYAPSTAHEIFQDQDKYLIFPFNFNQSFVDNYAKTNYSDATTISSYQTGTRTVTFAGYGTLILPQGSFSNVAMVSELRTNSLGPDSYLYTWYDISNGKKLMRYSSNNGNVTVVHSQDPVASIDEYADLLNVQVGPIPMTDRAIFKISGEELFNREFTLTDSFGKVQISQLFDGNEFVLYRNHLSNGIYFYSIKSNGKVIKGKLVL